MPMISPNEPQSVWAARAETALETALANLRDRLDPLPQISLAAAYVRVDMGELNPSDVPDLTEGS